jgi:hypothetical protein
MLLFQTIAIFVTVTDKKKNQVKNLTYFRFLFISLLLKVHIISDTLCS